MKKLLILFILILVAWELNAQVFIGGSLGINSTTSSTTTGTVTVNGISTFNFNISPEIGYFLHDNLAVGINLSVGTQSATTPGTINFKSSSTTWSVDPFIRYYLAKTGSFSFFGEGLVGVGGITTRNTTGTVTTDGPTTTTWTVAISPGISYDLSNRVSLLAKFGGLSFNTSSQKETTSGATTTNSNPAFGFNLNLNALSFGAIIKF